jgi:probable F420-dependent oxidoreductase
MTAALPLDAALRFGFITQVPGPAAAREIAELAERLGFDSIWTGDHVAFAVPILDPLLQLTQLACFSDRVTLGTSVYLLPLRHPVPVAKQIATLDRLCGGRLIFGVGVGGEFPGEYAACGVPLEERGARLSEAIPLLRSLWSGRPTSHAGRFYPIPETTMLPSPRQEGGPPIWGGGRSPAALRRLGRMGDGWISYVVTPERHAEGLAAIARAAGQAGREIAAFGSGHLLFTYVDESYEAAWDAATEHLSKRYAMDFRQAARRYAALGRPEDVAARIDAFVAAGLRHVVIDVVGPAGSQADQLERVAREVRPLLGSP